MPSLAEPAAPLTVILVVSSENDGGAARSTFLLARDLPHFGVRPIVALHREGELSRRLTAAGIAFEVVPGLPEDLTRRPGRPDSLWAVPGNVRAVPRAVSFLRDLAEREGASVLYGQGTWANILSALAARGSATGAVWHIRNDFRPRLKRLVMRGVARACGVRAIVAVSRSAAAPLEGLPMPLHVVENGADLAASDAARNAPDDLRQRLGIPGDRRRGVLRGPAAAAQGNPRADGGGAAGDEPGGEPSPRDPRGQPGPRRTRRPRRARSSRPPRGASPTGSTSPDGCPPWSAPSSASTSS